ncbi:MAG: hypothetical protein CM15mP102_04630 [Flavobacteriales bacterium]|nr:MAG: hypothetical protein CM15mP102_04630 [Flavobacteriales bacterium]
MANLKTSNKIKEGFKSEFKIFLMIGGLKVGFLIQKLNLQKRII